MLKLFIWMTLSAQTNVLLILQANNVISGRSTSLFICVNQMQCVVCRLPCFVTYCGNLEMIQHKLGMSASDR